MEELGGNRTRIEQGLRLLRATAYVFRSDLGDRHELDMVCTAKLGFGVAPFLRDIEDCGVMVRSHEEHVGRSFDWVVRTRPDAFFVSPFRLPEPGQFPPNAVIGKGDDSFAVVARDAVPGYFSLWQLAHICELFSVPARQMNHTIARLLPRHLRCGEATAGDQFGCVVKLTSWLLRLPEYNQGDYAAATNSSWGRRFVRSCVCNRTEAGTTWTLPRTSHSTREPELRPVTGCRTDWSHVRRKEWDPLWGTNICVYWPLATTVGGGGGAGSAKVTRLEDVGGEPVPSRYFL